MLIILKSNFQRHYSFLDILFNSFCNSLISIKDKSFPTRSAVSYHCRDHVSYLAVKPLMIIISAILFSMVSLSFFFFRKPVNFFLVVLFWESSTPFFSLLSKSIWSFTMFSYSPSFCNSSILACDETVGVFDLINGRKLSFSNIEFFLGVNFGDSSGSGLLKLKIVPQPEKMTNRYKINNVCFN